MARPAPPTGLAALSAVMSSTSTGALRGRRLLGLSVLMAVPLVIQTAILIWGHGRGSGFAGFVEMLDKSYLRIILPLALIFLGTAAFGDEWEGGTACYLVGVPVPRHLLVIGRWLASARRALALGVSAICALFVLCLVPHEGSLVHYLPDLALVLLGLTLAILGYTAVFIFLGLWLRRSVMTALIYVLLFEGFIGNLPLGFAMLSLSFHSRNLIWHMTGNEGFQPPVHSFEIVEPTGAITSLIWILGYQAVFLALSTWMLKRKEFTGGAEAVSTGTAAS